MPLSTGQISFLIPKNNEEAEQKSEQWREQAGEERRAAERQLLFFIFLVSEGKKEGIIKETHTQPLASGETTTWVMDETALKEEERVRLCHPSWKQARGKEVLVELRTVKKEDLLVSSWEQRGQSSTRFRLRSVQTESSGWFVFMWFFSPAFMNKTPRETLEQAQEPSAEA